MIVIMGMFPYCKKEVNLSGLRIEKKGAQIVGQERLYSRPFCNYVLGVSNVVGW